MRTLHSGGPPLRDLLPMGALLVAGLAMGLALGTKLTIAGGVAAMAVGVPLIMPPGTRRKATLIFLGGVAATAGFWFIRNLIHSGNPLPWLGELGPIDLPGPDRGLEGRDNFTVSHYLFDPDTSLWSQYFFRPITNLLGPAWPLFLGLSAAGTVLAIVRPRTQTVRMLGAVTVVSAIAYLFTPLTAAGPEGQPLAFGINLRYLVPALALGLALLTLEPKLTPERFRLPLLIGGVLAMGLTSKYSDSAYIWNEPFASIPFAALIGLFMIGVPVGIALLARRAKALAIAAAVLAAALVVAIGWERQDDYLDSRYTRAEDFRFQLDELAAWAKDTTGLQIGVAGTSGAYNQYLLYGDELSNRVQFIGQELPAGDFQALGNPDKDGSAKCPQFVDAVNDGDYDYVVTTPELDLNDPATAKTSPERGWLIGVTGAEEVLREGRVSVFRIEGELDPERLQPAPGANAMTGTGDYLLGMAALVAIGVSMAIAGRTLRRALLPGWSGAPALLAERPARDRDPGRDLRAARAGGHPRRGAADGRLRDRRRRRPAAGAAGDQGRAQARGGGGCSGTRPGLRRSSSGSRSRSRCWSRCSGPARPCWRSTAASTAATRSGTTCRSRRTSRRPDRSPSCSSPTRSTSTGSTPRSPSCCTPTACSCSATTSSRRCSTWPGSGWRCSPPGASAAPTAPARPRSPRSRR